MKSPDKHRLQNTVWYLLGAAALGMGLFFRFYRLDLDPPYFFAGTTQDLLTDPYNVIHYARNKILFGIWDIFDYPRWIVFKYTLSSYAAFLTFAIAGVSRVAANFSAAALNLGGILLFLAGLWRYSRKATCIAAVLLLADITLLTYGRLPFMENGLIFLSGLCYFVFVRFNRSKATEIILGAVAALCFLSGKAFGIVMIIPPLYLILRGEPISRRQRLIMLLVSFALTILVAGYIYYGKNFDSVYQYLSEQSVGMYGLPAALTSPVSLIIQAMTFGGQSRLFYFIPGTLLLLAVCILIYIWREKTGTVSTEHKRQLGFNAAWLLAGFAFLMLFNHRPLRYQLFLLLPVSGIIGLTIAQYPYKMLVKAKRFLQFALTFLLFWYLGAQAVLIFSNVSIYNNVINAVWWGLIPAIILISFTALFPAAFGKLLQGAMKYSYVMVLLFLIHQGVWVYEWLDKSTYDLKRAGYDLSQIVNEDAVIVGPYSSALTIDTRLRSFIYMFGLVQKEPHLFAKYNLTHLATDEANLGAAVRDYGKTVENLPLTRYFARDVEVQVIAVNRQDATQRYIPTAYEMAADLYNERKPDSAEIFVKEFLGRYPRSRSALVLLSNIYLQTQRFNEAIKTFDQLINIYPRDSYLYFYNGLYHYRLYLITRDIQFLKQSERLYESAVQINPTLEDDVGLSKKQTDQMFRRPTP